MIEADESGVPLLVLTADRPPELRGTGANQTIDQLKLYGSAVRWFCEVGVPEGRAGRGRLLAVAGLPGLGQRLRHGGRVPRARCTSTWRCATRWCPTRRLTGGRVRWHGSPATPAWCADGQPWTRAAAAELARGSRIPAPDPLDAASTGSPYLELPWTERGVVVCGDGDYDPEPLLRLAEAAGWPVLAEPSSNARHGPNALSAYPTCWTRRPSPRRTGPT